MSDYNPHSYMYGGEVGSGYYSANCLACHRVHDEATAMVLKALDEVPVTDRSRVFTIVDYGTADGGVSMPLITKMIAHLRSKYGEDLPINIIYEDQPVNDFKSVFLKVHGLEEGTQTYMKTFKNVYVLASGTQFYQTCLPPDTLDFGISFIAMHWLSKRPCNITGSISHTASTIASESRAFSEQAARDWETILLNRAMEMKIGGRFVVAMKSIGSGNTPASRKGTFREMSHVLQSMVEDGVITQVECDNTNINEYNRTVEDLVSPFNDPNSLVTKAGLKLISFEKKLVQCPHHENLVAKKGSGDYFEEKMAYISQYLRNIRVHVSSTLLAGLSGNRQQVEQQVVVDEWFERFGAAIAKEPEKHANHLTCIYLDIQKQ